MNKSHLNLEDLKKMETLLNIAVTTEHAVMTLKDGSRMTTELNILRTGAMAFLNISNSITIQFDNDAEFTGMDDETWEEWNK